MKRTIYFGNRDLGYIYPATITLLLTFFLGGCGSSDVEHLEKAHAYEIQGNIQSAAVEYKAALKRNPDSVEARFGLGKIHLLFGDMANAEKELRITYEANYKTEESAALLAQTLIYAKKYKQVLTEIDINNFFTPAIKTQVIAYHGLAHLGLGDMDSAAQSFEKALSITPGSEHALYAQAHWFFVQGEYVDALMKVHQALTKNPRFQDALLLLGDIHFALKKYEVAEHEYAQVIETASEKGLTNTILKANFGVIQSQLSQGKHELALKKVEYLLKATPGHPLPKYFRAAISYQKGNYALAEEYLLQVIVILHNHKPSLLLLGTLYFSQNNMIEADKYLTQYLTMDPSHTQARKLLATTRLKLHKPSMALEVLEPALDQTYTDVQTLIMAGHAAVRSGDLKVGTNYLKKALKEEPNNATILTELALAYLSESNTSKAISELKRASAIDDTSGQKAAVLIVLTHLKEGDIKKAKTAAKAFNKKHADKPIGHNLMGVVYNHSGNTSSAINSFSNALKIDSNYIPAIINLARMDQHSGELESATKRYESILLTDPNNTLVIQALAQLADRAGDKEKLVHWLKKSVEAAPQNIKPKLILAHYFISTHEMGAAEQLVNEAMNISSDSVAVLATKGILQLAQKDITGAYASFSELIQIEPSAIVGHYQLALIQFRNTELDKAHQSLNKVMTLNPNHLPATALLARINMQKGDLPTAQKIIDKMKSKLPNNIAVSILEADLMMAQGRNSNAIILYDKANEKQPHVSLVLKAAKAYRQMGYGDKTMNILLTWLKEHEDSYQVRLMLADEYELNKQRANAIDQYEILLRQFPRDIVTLNNLAWLYSQEDDNRAISTAKQAYTIAPEDPFVLDTYGWILVQNNDLEQGRALLKKAMDINSNISDIKYHYAVTLAKLGEIEQSKRILQKLVDKPKDLTVDIAGVREFLSQL